MCIYSRAPVCVVGRFSSFVLKKRALEVAVTV